MKALPVCCSLALCISYAIAEEIYWEPEVYPDNQIFPSLIIGTATMRSESEVFPAWEGNHIGEEQGIVGASVEGAPDGSEVELVVHGNDLFRESRVKGYAEDWEPLNIHPKISWDYGKLASVRQIVPLDITMELFIDGKSLGEKTVTAALRSVNDCLYGVVESGDDGEYSDYSWLFAAYVNEDHPWVDQTLKEALDTGIVSSFDGYQSNSPEQVLRQVFSIWNVMQRRGFRYSSITSTAGASNSAHSQHVRLFEDSINAAQANCVDGSVLLAALLRKIGIECSLVLIPGHMFLAFSLDEDTQLGLETTMMGDANLPAIDDKRLRSFLKFDPAEPAKDESWNTFEAAIDTGTEALKEAEKKSEDDSDYQIIEIDAARQLGILPISSRILGK